MKKLFTLFLMLAVSVGTLFAEYVKIGDLYYILYSSNLTAEVTYEVFDDTTNYIGLSSITIPTNVTYSSSTYSVTSISHDAFRHCKGLTSVTIPNSVTTIGSIAFGGCINLKSVTIPNSVTTIGSNAFGGCINLKSVTIDSNSIMNYNYSTQNISSYFGSQVTAYILGNHVTSIGSWAFSNCTGLTSVIILNGVTSIGYSAFKNCTGLTSITLPNSLTSIGESAFYNCSGLTSFTIPNSVTSIGSSAFENCTGLTSITLPNSLTSIGSYAFSGCSGLTSVTIPNSVTSIEENAFKNCTGLTSITLPNSLTSIGFSAFRGCRGLTSITIPNSVTSIAAYAFDGCSRLTAVHISDVAAWCEISFGGGSANPLLYAHNLYLNGALVTDLIIPNSVTSIGNYAFSGCSSLTSVTVPNSVTSIAAYAFSNCTGLTSVIILNGVTSIGESAFSNCTGLTSITLPNSLTSIGESAFYNCSGLTSVTIPNSVTSIGKSAFKDCRGLTSVTIPNSVTSIEENAFNNCSSLVAVYISDVAAWCEISFGGGSANPLLYAHNLYLNGALVTDLIIPNSVTSIGNYALYYCSCLTSVKIPNSVTSISKAAFSGCSNLSTVIIDSDSFMNMSFSANSNIGKYFGQQVTSYSIGNHVTGVGDYAFYECSNLTTLTLSSSINSIGADALTGCTSLSSIYVPCGELARFQQMLPDDSRVQYVPAQYVITISESANGHIDVPNYCSCDTSIPLTAIPDEGYHFVQWSDGNTDNPRNVELTQDTTFMAMFTIDRTGLCGEDSALIWEFDVDSKTLTINGVGQLTENYNYGLEAPTQAMHVVIGDDVTAIGDSAFYQMATIRTVTFGENVTSIGNYAFAGLNNRNFDELNLPSGLLTIGNSAFEECAYIETIDFGSSLESIGQNAFNGCTRVLSMICLAEITPEVGTNGLTSISSQAELYVQNDFKYRYEIDENWNRFLIKVYQEEQSTIEAIFSEEGSTTSQKVFSDGQILILRDGHVFDLTGQEVH